MEAIKFDQFKAPAEVGYTAGVVLGYDGAAWILRLDDGSEHSASVAVSCLVKPHARDRVSVFVDSGRYWIAAVLERFEEHPVSLEFHGDTELNCRAGRLTLKADQGIDLRSPRHVRINSPLIKLSAAMAEHCYKVASWVGDRLETVVTSIRSVSRTHERVTEQNLEAARVSIRKIEQVDRTEAGQIDCRADQSLSLRGGHILAKARKLTKIDGDQIQLG